MIRVKYNGEDITNQCEISRDDTSRKFKIATGRDLSDKDELLVIYDTAFLSMIDGDIKNTAFAYSEDADKVRAVSYTHLDVYKRQAQRVSLKEKLETMKVKAAGNNIENSVQRDKGKEEYL